MKIRKYLFLTGILSLLLLTSCDDFLDREPDNQVTEEVAFSNWDKVNGMANKLYREMRDRDRGIVTLNHFSLSGITDECKGTKVEQAIPDQFNFGSFGPSIGMPGAANGIYWNDLYGSIRKVNVFIEGVEKYNSPDNPLQPGDLKNRIAEAYFMRAYFHFLATRWYGDIVYMDYVADLAGDVNFVRQPWPEVLKKLLADLDFAIAELPARCITEGNCLVTTPVLVKIRMRPTIKTNGNSPQMQPKP